MRWEKEKLQKKIVSKNASAKDFEAIFEVISAYISFTLFTVILFQKTPLETD